ncbi:hypothetical protein R80B4_03079 [Fibrobacteres bacterium R8-0-B4]
MKCFKVKMFAAVVLAVGFFAFRASADSVVLQNGRIVENAKVVKVGTDEIEYKVGERETVYSAKKTELVKIVYDDGTEDVFDERTESAQAAAPLNVEGKGYGQDQNVSGEGGGDGSGNERFTSVGFLFPIKSEFYAGAYLTRASVMESGLVKGVDLNLGLRTGGNEYPRYKIFSAGIGFVYGYDLRLPENLHVIIGSPLGLYFELMNTRFVEANGDDDETNESNTYCFNILSPFIKIQYSYFEITYRGLVGYYTTKGNITAGSGRYQVSQDIKDSGFDWNRHLLTVGFCFGRSR